MNLLACSACDSQNCFIYLKTRNWLVCRECGQASWFSSDGLPDQQAVKQGIFDRVQRPGQSAQQVADVIKARMLETFWLPEPLRVPYTKNEEYRNYYNLLILLLHETSTLSAGSKG